MSNLTAEIRTIDASTGNTLAAISITRGINVPFNEPLNGVVAGLVESPAGNVFAAVQYAANTIYNVNFLSGVASQLATSPSTAAIALEPNGSVIFASGQFDSLLYSFDPATGKSTPLSGYIGLPQLLARALRSA